ncbi:MAG TPA: NYN domain-containing protein, partial [Steroidobacteraceae bacterium]|nr:NYN domain-containing protein [Steroidobacteraceae bacterium]
IIDAMDLLYTGTFSGFCLVSSDSDFTRLAARLREAGKLVIGFGERKTSKSLVAACDRFIYTDVLRSEAGGAAPSAPKDLSADKELMALLREAIDAASDDSGWAYLGGVGSNVQKRAPDFDSRNYGRKRLSDLIAAIDAFEFDRAKNRVRVRERKS